MVLSMQQAKRKRHFLEFSQIMKYLEKHLKTKHNVVTENSEV